jgi:ATP-dependent Lon protease
VLPIGGVREKALAARRAGIKTVILPAQNEPDLAELPEEIRKDMTFIPVETLEQVVNVALAPQQGGREPYSSDTEKKVAMPAMDNDSRPRND